MTNILGMKMETDTRMHDEIQSLSTKRSVPLIIAMATGLEFKSISPHSFFFLLREKSIHILEIILPRFGEMSQISSKRELIWQGILEIKQSMVFLRSDRI